MNPIAMTGMRVRGGGPLKESLGRGVLPRPNPADPVKDKNCSFASLVKSRDLML